MDKLERQVTLNSDYV